MLHEVVTENMTFYMYNNKMISSVWQKKSILKLKHERFHKKWPQICKYLKSLWTGHMSNSFLTFIHQWIYKSWFSSTVYYCTASSILTRCYTNVALCQTKFFLYFLKLWMIPVCVRATFKWLHLFADNKKIKVFCKHYFCMS